MTLLKQQLIEHRENIVPAFAIVVELLNVLRYLVDAFLRDFFCSRQIRILLCQNVKRSKHSVAHQRVLPTGNAEPVEQNATHRAHAITLADRTRFNFKFRAARI